MLLDPLPVTSKYGTTAIVSDVVVDTDLSGLTPIQDAQVESDRLWLQQQEEEMVEAARNTVFIVAVAERCQIPMQIREAWRQLLK